MKDYETNLTQKKLKEVLSYDATTGQFHWRVNASRNAQKGDLAGAL